MGLVGDLNAHHKTKSRLLFQCLYTIIKLWLNLLALQIGNIHSVTVLNNNVNNTILKLASLTRSYKVVITLKFLSFWAGDGDMETYFKIVVSII